MASRRPKPSHKLKPQVVIDLTLSGDEDNSYVQRPLTVPSARHAHVLVEVPPMQHGLPMFTTNADHKSEQRNGASGVNYAMNPHAFKPSPVALDGPSSSRPRSASRPSAPSKPRKPTLPRSASLENLSSGSVQMVGSHRVANSAKRRKTTHKGLSLGGQGSETPSASLDVQSLQKSNQHVDLTVPPTAQPRTVITGASRLQSSYDRSPPSTENETVHETLRLENKNDTSMAILQKVFEIITRALQPYTKHLSLHDQKEIKKKVEAVTEQYMTSSSLTIPQTAAWLVRPELKTNYESNNGQFSPKYEQSMLAEAAAYVESYVETMKELANNSRRLNGLKESGDDSESSANEQSFDRQRSVLSEAQSRSYSESPTTELSNDQPGIDSFDRAFITEPDARSHSKPVAADNANLVRRSARTTKSQLSYAPIRRTRRKVERPGMASQFVTGIPIDQEYESESSFGGANQNLDSRDELSGIKAVARTMQAPPKKPEAVLSERKMLSLLTQREFHGGFPAGVARGRMSIKAAFRANLEDSFARQSEWTDASGDIQHISWVTEDAFLCGATAHLDSHNMEYNKPGNLLLGSVSHDTLKSFADHRVPRPISNKSQNAESMRQSQDPWLYSSVVSTAHCKKNGYSFTACFDETVKVWRIERDGSNMEVVNTWEHGGKVNFVVTSNHHERIATATGVHNDAVRVYNFDETSIAESWYNVYGGDKANSQIEDDQATKKWSYQPATIQWGKASQVADLLLVGYSPRSDTGDDVDIPDEKKNTGELCVWNTLNGAPIQISASHSQNVFEVQWHPSQPIFVAATSPAGIFDSDKTKTQIRLFALNEMDIFTNTRSLDCAAIDINELTIMPNALLHCFVTASCTDGNTYVYDTARGDQPIHILQHEEPLDPLDPDLPPEIGDTGVQFAAWGQATERFYTGGSDGKVKAWNIKASPGKAFVRDVLSLAGAIISGAFSKDFSKLLIGDATGKVHLLSVNDKDLEGGPIVTNPKRKPPKKSTIVDDEDLEEGAKATKVKSKSYTYSNPEEDRVEESDDECKRCRSQKRIFNQEQPCYRCVRKEGMAGKSTVETGNNSMIKIHQLLDQKSALLSNAIKRPKLIMPHKEPPPPAGLVTSLPEEHSVVDIAQGYLKEGWLTQLVGRGVYQGPNYTETPWFDRTAHEDNDPTQPLLPEFLVKQQFLVQQEKAKVGFELLPRIKSSDPKNHEENMSLDLALSQMSLNTRQSLEKERVEIEGDFSHTFDYELVPSQSALWKSKKKKVRKNEASSGGSSRERSLDDANKTMGQQRSLDNRGNKDKIVLKLKTKGASSGSSREPSSDGAEKTVRQEDAVDATKAQERNLVDADETMGQEKTLDHTDKSVGQKRSLLDAVISQIDAEASDVEMPEFETEKKLSKLRSLKRKFDIAEIDNTKNEMRRKIMAMGSMG